MSKTFSTALFSGLPRLHFRTLIPENADFLSLWTAFLEYPIFFGINFQLHLYRRLFTRSSGCALYKMTSRNNLPVYPVESGASTVQYKGLGNDWFVNASSTTQETKFGRFYHMRMELRFLKATRQSDSEVFRSQALMYENVLSLR